MGISTARGTGGVVNSLVKKGYLTKVFNPQSSKITLYDLTEKGKEFSTERKINKGE
jgi:DNA-binding MarR family transcriptional regulator